MKGLTAEETLKNMIKALTTCLLELEGCREKTDFLYGERTAYVECLEWLRSWQHAKENGLDYEVEKRFPL